MFNNQGGKMSKDITEYIDDYCRDNYGHTDWSYLSSLSDKDREEIDTAPDFESVGVEEIDYSTGIVFYKHNKQEEK